MDNKCAQLCNCNFTMSNTGTDCQPLMEVVKKLLLIPVYDSLGVRNFIDLTTPITAATFTAMINQVDASKRLFPLPELKAITDTRGEPIYEEFPDRSRAFIANGTRQFDGVIVGRDGNPTLLSKIESARCGEMGVYAVDRLGNLIGIVSSDGTQLFPMRLDSNSISANFIKATDTTIQKVQLQFNYHPDESDNCLRLIPASEMDNVNLLVLKGLLDVFAIFSNISTTGVTVKLFTQYGTILNPTTVKGLVVADFVSTDDGATSRAYNQTDNLNVTLTSVTESTTSPGTYDLVFAAQTVGDIMKVTCVKNGFDFTAVAADQFVIV